MNWEKRKSTRRIEDVRTEDLIQKMDNFLREMQVVADRLVTKLSDLDGKD